MVPALSHEISRVSWYSGYCRPASDFVYGAFTLLASFSKTVPLSFTVTYAVRTPQCTHRGLGSSGFARRYFRNHCCFLFLRLLRCFSSPGSLRTPMCSVHGDWLFASRVSPFRHPWITGYLLLPTAFRSLSRLSSALSAKASVLRPFLLDLSRSRMTVNRSLVLFRDVNHALACLRLLLFLVFVVRLHIFRHVTPRMS